MRNWINLIEAEVKPVVEWKTLLGHELRPLVWGPKGKDFDLPFLKGSEFAKEHHLTAWVDGRLIADAELKQSPSNPDEVWLMHVAVMPQYQGRGYGKVMMSWAFKTAMDLGKKSMTISSYTEQGQERLDTFARQTAERFADKIDVHFNSDGPRRRIAEAYGDDVVKFWIDRSGKTHMLEPGEHHTEAITRLGTEWVPAMRSGWVRGFFETRNDTMNYNFMEKRVTSAAIKEMLRMARECKAVAFNLEEAVTDVLIGGSALSSREFSQYIRSKSVAPAPLAPLMETKHDGYQTWSTITDSYQGEAFGYCQAEVGERPIGYINFSIYQGRAHVKMIEVSDDWKRKGVATNLMKELAMLVDGDENIDWGEHTEDGMAFHAAYGAAPLSEGFKGDDEGLCLKGWFDFLNNRWVDVPQGWHHSGIVWNNPDKFRWDTVFKYTPEEYYERFERHSRTPPKWDDEIIDSMIDADWGRIGMVANSQKVYVNAKTLTQGRRLLLFYVKNVCPADDITDVFISDANENHVQGDVASVLRRTHP